MKLKYLSHGTIPSTSANTVQVMKMSEALASVVDQFELVISSALLQFGAAAEFQLFDWYGISSPFPVRRIPVCLAVTDAFSSRARTPLFSWLSARYAWLSGADLIYTRHAGTALRAANFGVRVILESHKPIDESQHSAMGLVNHPNLAGVVTISPVITKSFVSMGVPDDRVLHLEDGVDLERFVGCQPADIGVSERPKVVHAGSLGINRGIELVFELAARFPDTDFIFVGGHADQVSSRKAEAVEQKLSNCQFTGFVPNSELPDYLAAADVLIMPYSQKIRTVDWMSPMKMFEYMAAGKPILAPRLPALESVLYHDVNAWLTTPDDVESYSSGLRQLMSDDALRTRLGDTAAENVKEFTWTRRAERILDRLAPDLDLKSADSSAVA